MLAGMCHCRGLDQARDLAAGLPGRPVVMFQPRNLPELFPESLLAALSRRAGDEQGPGRGWAWLMWLCANTHLESVTTWKKPTNSIVQEWPWTGVFTPDLVLVLQGGQFITTEDGQVALAVARGLNSSQRTGVKANQTSTKSGLLQESEPRSLRKY